MCSNTNTSTEVTWPRMASLSDRLLVGAATTSTLDGRTQHRDAPGHFFSDRNEALLNALENIFPTIPSHLFLWHIVKDVETHARKHGYPQVLGDAESSPKWKGSHSHRQFCDAFLAVVRATSVQEYEMRRVELHMLAADESTYVDTVWLDIWERRIVCCWTNNVVHVMGCKRLHERKGTMQH
jgi:hypothetical protein